MKGNGNIVFSVHSWRESCIISPILDFFSIGRMRGSRFSARWSQFRAFFKPLDWYSVPYCRDVGRDEVALIVPTWCQEVAAPSSFQKFRPGRWSRAAASLRQSLGIAYFWTIIAIFVIWRASTRCLTGITFAALQMGQFSRIVIASLIASFLGRSFGQFSVRYSHSRMQSWGRLLRGLEHFGCQ